MPDTWVVVLEIPNCDLCGPKSPLYGTGLGLGMGQELLLEPPNATA